jgi:hypothetical protein
MVESTLTSQPKQPEDRRPRPVAGGHVPPRRPTRTRHLIPSMSCRLLHLDGRPALFPLGSTGSSTAHWASVTYALTDAGRALLPALEQITRWSEQHLPH